MPTLSPIEVYELRSGGSKASMTKCREEEASFSRTLQKGIERFKKAAGGAAGKVFSGRDAFELYDTYGFPMDLTEVQLLSLFKVINQTTVCF